MNEIMLKRTLNSIGRTCFVKHFELLTNLDFSTDQIVEKLIQLEGYSENGCRTRANCSKRIVKNNLTLKALDLIIETKKIPIELKQKADLLKRNACNPKVYPPY